MALCYCRGDLLLNRWPFFYYCFISVVSKCLLSSCCAGEVALQSTQNSLFVSGFTENQQHLGKGGQLGYCLVDLSKEVRSRWVSDSIQTASPEKFLHTVELFVKGFYPLVLFL